MTTLSLSNLSGGQSLVEAMRAADTVGENPQFQAALARNKVDWVAGADEPARAAQVQAVAPVGQVQPTEAAKPVSANDPDIENSVVARDRVRRSLELNGAEGATGGDLILNGLGKLRGAFDAHHQHINAVMNSNAVDPRTLMAMQMELAQYTVMVDISSKLTGKAAQSLDTLMKGQ